MAYSDFSNLKNMFYPALVQNLKLKNQYNESLELTARTAAALTRFSQGGVAAQFSIRDHSIKKELYL